MPKQVFECIYLRNQILASFFPDPGGDRRIFSFFDIHRFTGQCRDSTRRFLVSNLPAEILVDALRGMATTWEVNGSIERQLTEILKQNPEDWSAQRKLKLLKVCKTLCAPKVPLLLALTFTGNRAADVLTLGILGHDGECKMSLADLCDPDVSPVVVAHEHIVELMAAWDETNDKCALMLHLGADFQDRDLRLGARAHFLRMESGLVTYYSIRLSHPPYSLTVMLTERLETVKDAAVDNFFDLPFKCGSLMLQNWRTRFSREQFKRLGGDEVRTWLHSCGVAIDFSERSHGQMRQDINTVAGSAEVRRAGDRMFCRQLSKAHLKTAKTATLPSLTSVLTIATEAKRVEESSSDNIDGRIAPSVPVQQGKGKSAPSKHPGSPWIRFLDMKEKAFKLLHGVEGEDLSPAQRAEVLEKARGEWAAIQEQRGEALASYKAWNRACKDGKLVAHEKNKVQLPASNRFKGLWGSSSRPDMPIDPIAFADFTQSECGKACKKQYDSAGDINEDNLSELPPLIEEMHAGPISLVTCCWNQKKNVCREHVVPAALRSGLDRLCEIVNYWIDSTTPEERQKLSMPALWYHCPGGHSQHGEDLGTKVGSARLGKTEGGGLGIGLEVT